MRGRGRRRCRAPILARRARPPQRKPVRAGHGLDVTAVAMRFAGVPQVNGLAPDACRLLPAPAGGDDLAVQDHERRAIGQCPRQRVRQLERLRGQHLYHLVDIAVAGGPRDAMVPGQRLDRGLEPVRVSAPTPGPDRGTVASQSVSLRSPHCRLHSRPTASPGRRAAVASFPVMACAGPHGKDEIAARHRFRRFALIKTVARSPPAGTVNQRDCHDGRRGQARAVLSVQPARPRRGLPHRPAAPPEVLLARWHRAR